MFGCFGFDGCDRRSERRVRSDRRSEHRTGHRNRFCSVLRNISIGTPIALLTIRDNGSFNNVVFEGFSNGVALFSGVSTSVSVGTTTTGLLRVCPHDVVAIVF
ncbi:DUF3915 family protein [Bacillus sp. FJAT-53711]|uniref:DUF3915 family protein n=1 Tax=Bacillus yunxiaonensis TaxID=3127665 RepID=A0ABU8FSV1_9BACI